jgi:hypothetical protein
LSKKDIRRHHRLQYLGRVRISWESTRGPKYAAAKCLDVSEGGLRIEAPEPIPVYTSISLYADQINLSGAAIVKHVERRGSKYILGLELSHALRERTLSEIREAETSHDPAPVA